jgi:hypothetical protein
VARSGAVKSYDNGLNDNYDNDDNANDNVVVAGAPLPNFCLLFSHLHLYCVQFHLAVKFADDEDRIFIFV